MLPVDLGNGSEGFAFLADKVPLIQFHGKECAPLAVVGLCQNAVAKDHD